MEEKDKMTSNKDKVFHMTIVGKTGRGKTWCLLDLLEREYKDYFNYIFLICPTVDYNETWKEWKYFNDPDFVIVPCTIRNVEKKIEEVLEASKERGSFKEGNRSLLILDDCGSCKEVKKQDGALSTAAFGSRHQGLPVIFLTQFTSVAKAWRDNQDYFVFFNNPNYQDMVAMFKRFLGRVSKEERENILDDLESEDYSRLELDISINKVLYRVVLFLTRKSRKKIRPLLFHVGQHVVHDGHHRVGNGKLDARLIPIFTPSLDPSSVKPLAALSHSGSVVKSSTAA